MFKKSAFLILTAAIFIISGCAQQEEKVYPFSFDTAKIEFKMSGNLEGTKTLYIKGNKSLVETHAVRKGEADAQINTLYIDQGAVVYNVDLNTKSAVQSGNPVYEALKNLPAEKRMEYLIKLATGNTLSEGPAPTPTAKKTYAGKECDVYIIQGLGEACIWDGVGLYAGLKIPEAAIDNSAEAVSIELNIAIDDSKFELPADVKLQTSEAASS